MKFANNHSYLFVDCGSEISFIIGFNQCILSIFCECINMWMLSNQHTVSHCIIHFVALEVVMELSKIFQESL
jgi:hypothetical protein